MDNRFEVSLHDDLAINEIMIIYYNINLKLHFIHVIISNEHL